MIVRDCKICGRTFESKHNGTCYCSDECRMVGLRRSWRKSNEKKRGKKPRVYVKSNDRTVENTCPKDCKYIGGKLKTCDYYIKTHRLRGGDVTTCTVYERSAI